MTDDVSRELKKFDETGKITPRLSEILKLMPLEDLFSMKPRPTVTSRDSIICSACNSALNAVMGYIQTHSQEDVLNLVASLCAQLINFSEEVCNGVVALNMVSGFL
jgi:hypothetical protein